ncbi:PucR family transcriptional regulator [Nocardioides sp.]|uniref:PucR family transcriptional regulator n=1 Tax=Nocardioides sp. TaxID=35761 RepID=UPI0039E3334A
MIETRFERSTFVTPQLAARFRDGAGPLVTQIAHEIQAAVPEYAGPANGQRRRLIRMAVAEAVAHFLRTIEGQRSPIGKLDDLFCRMGYGEATDGNDLGPMDTALRLATRAAAGALRTAAAEEKSSAALLGHLEDELVYLIDHLSEQARLGYEMAHRAFDRDVARNRRRLAAELLQGVAEAALRERAEKASWPLPARLVVVAAETTLPVEWPVDEGFDGKVLTVTDLEPVLYICAAEDATLVSDTLRGSGPTVRMALSWPVELADVPDARRWTERALYLARDGVLPRTSILDCTSYRTQLWLHSEPALRRQLAQELLRPLIAETPNSREILTETLLAWLETRDSAPALAAILGVHPQTVRYRWRRINEIFGESLHDPEFVVQLTMVLKASVPLWVAGDQSDFERYWNEELA